MENNNQREIRFRAWDNEFEVTMDWLEFLNRKD